MKKIIFGIFAHPDDEAFGPAGTLLLETKAGTELHLITLTAGENGTNPDNHQNLGQVRLDEWHNAANLIGAATTYHLGYADGHLDNVAMIDAATRIEKIVTEITSQSSDTVEIEFMTLDPNGLTGHIDHIVACRAACFVFYRLKATDSRLTRIRFACLPREQNPVIRTDWIYMDAGRPDGDIDETIDARLLRDEIIAIMACHATQRADYEAALKRQGNDLGLDHFIVAQ
jgi:LmbE family N-acetylglucosaminyl deacetylase